MEIFIIREGRQAGPFSAEAVKAFLVEGTARTADLGWRKGMADWRPLEEVLRVQAVHEGPSKTPPAAGAPAATGSGEKHVPATGKQKALLKFLGAEFGETLEKARAALAISDALETPKLQSRIRKWHEEKLRQHPDVFQDEIDFRKANRANRYLERVQTEGSEVVKDVTKAHVQVLVESLDKRHPGWETERESALWDFLLPAVGEHFPQLVEPAQKERLKSGLSAKSGASGTRGMGRHAGGIVPPRAATGTFGAMMRGVVLGVIALGAIVTGHHFWQERGKAAPSAGGSPVSKSPAKNETAALPVEPAAKSPTAPAEEKLFADARVPDTATELAAKPATPEPATLPEPPAPEPAAAPPAMNAEKPAPPPAPPEGKPAAAAPMTPAAEPAMAAAPAPEVATPPVPPVQRTAVKLIQRIGVMLSNGQVTLPAGTPLRYLGAEGPNVRVSWNNNVFFVPAMATDVNDPLPAPSDPANPAAPNATKPKKPADDL